MGVLKPCSPLDFTPHLWLSWRETNAVKLGSHQDADVDLSLCIFFACDNEATGRKTRKCGGEVRQRLATDQRDGEKAPCRRQIDTSEEV